MRRRPRTPRWLKWCGLTLSVLIVLVWLVSLPTCWDCHASLKAGTKATGPHTSARNCFHLSMAGGVFGFAAVDASPDSYPTDLRASWNRNTTRCGMRLPQIAHTRGYLLTRLTLWIPFLLIPSRYPCLVY